MKHGNRDFLKGRFPYTDPLPKAKRERFIDEVIDEFLLAYLPDSYCATSVSMVRLEVEEVKRSGERQSIGYTALWRDLLPRLFQHPFSECCDLRYQQTVRWYQQVITVIGR